MATAPFYLILMFVGGPSAHTVVLPMATMEACANASLKIIGGYEPDGTVPKKRLSAKCVASGFEE